MRLSDILSDPLLMAEVRRRACGNAGMPLGPPVNLPVNAPPSEPPKGQQRINTEPAARARTEQAANGQADRGR